MNPYLGNDAQIFGVDEARLVGGKGDGMRVLRVRNGSGLDFTVSLDRCADISRLAVNGVNMGYFAPCGYVAPQYYDPVGAGFLKSFTAGFFTTCGLRAVGTPCTDEGEELGLHGTISNTPAVQHSYYTENNEIHIRATVIDAALFAQKLRLEREYVCPIGKNEIRLHDTVTNIGSADCPLEMLYHCNMGYPLLDEDAVVTIPSTEVLPRNEHAKEGIENCLKMEKPQQGYEEKCYYHTLSGTPTVSIFNRKLGKGVSITYDTAVLPFFTEWKMMGCNEYVLGLEPGNCTPDGRDVMRKKGLLEILAPGQTKTHDLTFEFSEE
ncbi:MAG: aldose 1-epimerase family protein [Eubacteriales bacterium]